MNILCCIIIRPNLYNLRLNDVTEELLLKGYLLPLMKTAKTTKTMTVKTTKTMKTMKTMTVKTTKTMTVKTTKETARHLICALTIRDG